MYVYVYMYMYMYMYICICIYVYVCICMYMAVEMCFTYLSTCSGLNRLWNLELKPLKCQSVTNPAQNGINAK